MDEAAAAAAKAAGEAAFRQSTIEGWTLYGVGICATMLRTYARIRAVGIKHLQWDDYLVWVAAVFYTVQSTLAYSIGSLANGLANNGMTDAERAALSPNSPEYEFRVIGSKIQVAGWTTYSTLLAFLKLAMLVFFVRLTQGLGRKYTLLINIGFALVIGTYVASIASVFVACRPFNKYWQINPDPGTICQAGISRPIIWVSFAANILTDTYLLIIPLPMLWQSTLRPLKKIASSIVLGAGIFVLVCATLKSVFVLTDPINGGQLAGTWGTRETFVAVITTNLPMIFPLFRAWLRPIFGSTAASKKTSYPQNSAFQTIGGTGGNSRARKPGAMGDPLSANVTFSESEEHIVRDDNAYSMKVFGGGSDSTSSRSNAPVNGIVVSNEVRVISGNREDMDPERGEPGAYGKAW
ncbi:related to integral membrane protein PTH11 [Cephalotrichum gorgonifer]|uniref:Related to integral membrane protein PTH11 n=1 Tax=Cephalotrichum gorgonifer TaxID=2041049 RepID=A0AAE8N3S2_9PEZI|nr:related to integral membrane protein PTH11 [Cephalotrichum gorgonifer]